MLEATHYTAAAKQKGSYALPAEFDGTVNASVLYQAVRAFQNNQRQGTHATRTKAEVSGGNQKPWRQKGTGRARQGSTRAPHWRGGGAAFGPKPRDYTTTLPRKVKRLARQSALNARAAEGAVAVIEQLQFEAPKTKQMAELLHKLELTGKKVLVMTAESQPAAYLSARNIPNVRVLRYGDAAAFDVLWAEALVIEEHAIGGHAIKGAATKAAGRAKRTKKAAERSAKATKATKAKASKKKATKKKTTQAKKE